MSEQKNDGGPAYPVLKSSTAPFGDVEHKSTGMTLRDYFAAQALVGVLAAPRVASDAPKDLTAGYFAHLAYALADAMLEKRA